MVSEVEVLGAILAMEEFHLPRELAVVAAELSPKILLVEESGSIMKNIIMETMDYLVV